MIAYGEVLLRLCLAALLGGLIGLERERQLWAAGIRTHTLVAVGASLIIIVSAFGFKDVLGSHIILDPSRIAAQVVSGIGFLGAGAIILRGEMVRGLTTAASIWIVAAIGLAIGGGLYFAGIAATIIILVILVAIKPFEDRYKSQRMVYILTFETKHGELTINLLRELIGSRTRHVAQLEIQPNASTGYDQITIHLNKISKKAGVEFIEMIKQIPSIRDKSISIKFIQPT